MMLRVTGKLGTFSGHPMIEHFRFVQSHTRATAEDDDPLPTSLHFRYGRDAVPETIYPAMEDFYADLGQTYRQAVRAFADAGCRYLQLDEVNFAYLCDPKLRQQVKDRGEDPEPLPSAYAEHDQRRRLRHTGRHGRHDASLPRQLPVHLRGERAATSRWPSSCSTPSRCDGYFMEYDTERAGGFEPLRFVPKGKTVVLGLVTSKSGTLESKDEIKRRIDAGGEVHRRRTARAQPAMRLRLDRGRQHPGRGRAMGEAQDDRGARRGGLGDARA